jgi:hypothetical protein
MGNAQHTRAGGIHLFRVCDVDAMRDMDALKAVNFNLN